jgi:hypothetical protein
MVFPLLSTAASRLAWHALDHPIHGTEDRLIYSLPVVPENGLPSVHALECYPC